MDKELLRLVIILIGAVVIIGMILWSVLKNKRKRRSIDFYDKGNPLGNIDESLVLNTDHDDFDIVPLGSALDDEYAADPISVASDIVVEENIDRVEPQLEPEPQQQPLPSIIQFSIVALNDEGFNGKALAELFQQIGLEYGSMKVFERIDAQRQVDFAVASMVEPGIFPDSDLENFYTPGIAFFLQPAELDRPLEIFEDYINTINLLANELDGLKWDHNRDALTEETIDAFRQLLAQA